MKNILKYYKILFLLGLIVSLSTCKKDKFLNVNTNPNYPALLIGVIEKYRLDQYDSPEGEIQKIKRIDRVFTEIDKNADGAQKDSVNQDSTISKIYVVKQGDTLYNISKRFGLTVDDLKTLNSLADNNIKIGQKLFVVK